MIARNLLAALLLSAAGAPAAAQIYQREPGSQMPFSASVRVGDTVYLSGQIGVGPDGKVPADFDTQSRIVMDRIKAAAIAAGSDMDHIAKCTVMLDDMALWPRFNAIYRTYFKPERLPARSAFGADGLALGAAVEVECIAVVPPAR